MISYSGFVNPVKGEDEEGKSAPTSAASSMSPTKSYSMEKKPPVDPLGEVRKKARQAALKNRMKNKSTAANDTY